MKKILFLLVTFIFVFFAGCAVQETIIIEEDIGNHTFLWSETDNRLADMWYKEPKHKGTTTYAAYMDSKRLQEGREDEAVSVAVFIFNESENMTAINNEFYDRVHYEQDFPPEEIEYLNSTIYKLGSDEITIYVWMSDNRSIATFSGKDPEGLKLVTEAYLTKYPSTLD